MGFFKEFGVSDWSARLPSTSGAFVLIILIFLHMRRFRPGGHLDAALITASCVGIVSFARGASTDMQLAAPFCIGMLGWYAWYETGKKFWLFDLYFFGAAATLAKGPVAPFLALVIILLFAGLRREWSLLRRTIWLPGVLLYLVMVLPWYIAVQKTKPHLLRFFFLEHNLERFATNRYQHHQPFWYYLAVLLIGLMPWTVIALRALVDSIQVSIAEWKVRHNPQRYLGHSRAGDAFPEFLVLWALFPILFFSFSGSKLPGYILPSIPPLTILTADYLNRIRRDGLPKWLLWSHAAHLRHPRLCSRAGPAAHEVRDAGALRTVADDCRCRSHRIRHRGVPDRPSLGHLADLQCDAASRYRYAGLPARLPRQGSGPELFRTSACAGDPAARP